MFATQVKARREVFHAERPLLSDFPARLCVRMAKMGAAWPCPYTEQYCF